MTSSTSRTGRCSPDAAGWQRRFVDEMGGLSVTPKASPAAMRVLAWMAVCEPREQTARQIQDQLGLSAGSVSSAVRMLGQAGVLERAAQVGTRCVFYTLAERGWECMLEARLRTVSELRRVAERAIDAAGAGADTRLVTMQETSRTMEEGVAELLRSRHQSTGPIAPNRSDATATVHDSG